MGTLFGGGGTPSVPEPIAPPTVDQNQAAADYADKLRRRKGRQSTILSADDNDTLGASVSQKNLLGS